jgi:hypothetical protein
MAGLGLGEAGATLRPASSRAGSDDSKTSNAVHTDDSHRTKWDQLAFTATQNK